METQSITLERGAAQELFRKYQAHRHYSTPVDLEIQRTYNAIAKGRVVIRALASIVAAGLNDQGLPKLGIVRANAETCCVYLMTDGRARFSHHPWPRENHRRQYIDLPAGSFPGGAAVQRHRAYAAQAQVPLVPIHLRPKRGLENYHILFEAEWRPIPPKDPLLLRRIGKADLWIVCAAWDLTEVERAVLAGRL